MVLCSLKFITRYVQFSRYLQVITVIIAPLSFKQQGGTGIPFGRPVVIILAALFEKIFTFI